MMKSLVTRLIDKKFQNDFKTQALKTVVWDARWGIPVVVLINSYTQELSHIYAQELVQEESIQA